MCVVSMIMDHYGDEWQRRYDFLRQTTPQWPWPPPTSEPAVTDAEIAEFRKLLERAREYDKRNQEPDCELKAKRDRIRKLAEELGVTVDFV